jgi:hypothetical protein
MTHQDIVNTNKQLVLEAIHKIEGKRLTKVTIQTIRMKLSATGNRRSESCIKTALISLEKEGVIEKISKIKKLGSPVEWGTVENE